MTTVGMQFGPYHLRRRLGTGGMASVWTAVDEAGRALVVKRILPSLAADAEFVAMFDREATLSARMRHPNIVRVVDHGDYEGERYLAMEQLHGRDLSTVMSVLVAGGAPAPGLGAYVGLGVCRALAYVHALAGDDGAPLHLIHRDVSLSNVMLGFDGGVKLLDFGVAKALAGERTHRTQAGVLKGKWAYLAPEQVEGGAVDQRADIFALGIVLWETLTGRRLFKAASGMQTLERVRAAWVLPPSTINPAVPAALDAIVMKALAKAPAERWQSAAAMAAALDKVVATIGFDAAALGMQMALLFSDDAAAYHRAQPFGAAALEPTDPGTPGEPRGPFEPHDTDETPPADVAAVRALAAERLSPAGATLAELRRRRPRRRVWRLLLAAALASLVGGYTGWQIAHADGALHAALVRLAAK